MPRESRQYPATARERYGASLTQRPSVQLTDELENINYEIASSLQYANDIIAHLQDENARLERKHQRLKRQLFQIAQVAEPPSRSRQTRSHPTLPYRDEQPDDRHDNPQPRESEDRKLPLRRESDRSLHEKHRTDRRKPHLHHREEISQERQPQPQSDQEESDSEADSGPQNWKDFRTQVYKSLKRRLTERGSEGKLRHSDTSMVRKSAEIEREDVQETIENNVEGNGQEDEEGQLLDTSEKWARFYARKKADEQRREDRILAYLSSHNLPGPQKSPSKALSSGERLDRFRAIRQKLAGEGRLKPQSEHRLPTRPEEGRPPARKEPSAPRMEEPQMSGQQRTRPMSPPMERSNSKAQMSLPRGGAGDSRRSGTVSENGSQRNVQDLIENVGKELEGVVMKLSNLGLSSNPQH